MNNKDFYNLDTSWIDNVQINLSAVERRTTTLTKRRTVKKEFQVAWLLKAVTLIDLTTLSGDDTFGKVDRLCQKALSPIALNILNELDRSYERLLLNFRAKFNGAFEVEEDLNLKSIRNSLPMPAF